MKGMGFRTIKTAVGAGLALWISSYLNIEYSTFTAIIAIMCIEQTKRKTLLSMRDKFFASLLSLLLGAFIFELLGYYPFIFAIFILFFIPLIIRLRIQNGFVTSMVVLTHVYMIKDVSLTMFLNELYIIFIGMGIALIVNSFMPDLQQNIHLYKQEVEQKFTIILYEFSAHLRDSSRMWDGKELLEAEILIDEAMNIALQDVENQLLKRQDKDYHYLEMRGNQLGLLNQMMKTIATFTSSSLHVKQKEMLADFLEELSENVHSGDTTENSLKKIDTLHTSFRETALPKVREEFEVRANLFYLLFEIKKYVILKQKLFAR